MDFKPKYFKTKKFTDGVNFILEGENEKSPRSHICYSAISYGEVDKKWTAIVIREPVEVVTYDEPEVRRWLNDLNEVGFPCHFEEMNSHLQVRLILKEYKSKLHLISTLMLIRILWEHGMNKIPDLYFQFMDKHPNANKFIQIQRAHKHPSLVEDRHGYRYAKFNSNHTVTSPSYARNINRKELFERLKKGMGVWDKMNPDYRKQESISVTWSKEKRMVNE